MAIGFVGGVVTHRTLSQNRFEQMREKMDKSKGYVEYMTGAMQLTEDQKIVVQPILEEFAPKMHDHHRRFRSEVKIMMDSLSQEIAPHVNEEQLSKLKKRFHRKRNRSRKPKPQP